jgi:hypothetical protein
VGNDFLSDMAMEEVGETDCKSRLVRCTDGGVDCDRMVYVDGIHPHEGSQCGQQKGLSCYEEE